MEQQQQQQQQQQEQQEGFFSRWFSVVICGVSWFDVVDGDGDHRYIILIVAVANSFATMPEDALLDGGRPLYQKLGARIDLDEDRSFWRKAVSFFFNRILGEYTPEK